MHRYTCVVVEKGARGEWWGPPPANCHYLNNVKCIIEAMCPVCLDEETKHKTAHVSLSPNPMEKACRRLMPQQQEIKTQQGIKMIDFSKQSLFES